MRWIVSPDKDIIVDASQLRARRKYIQLVTNAEVSEWRLKQIDYRNPKKYHLCTSNDGMDGVFITAHIQDVCTLCSLSHVYESKFIIANTCILKLKTDKCLLSSMKQHNREVELWFAKQDFSIEKECGILLSTELQNVGKFDFQTSRSERELFKYRTLGFMQAVRKSFDPVLPPITPLKDKEQSQ